MENLIELAIARTPLSILNHGCRITRALNLENIRTFEDFEFQFPKVKCLIEQKQSINSNLGPLSLAEYSGE